MKKINLKADEFEMAINFKSMRISYAFISLALLGYCIVTLVQSGEVPTVPGMILCLTGVLFWSTKIFMTKHLTKGIDDEE